MSKYAERYREKLLGNKRVLSEEEAASWLKSQGYKQVVTERLKTKIKLKKLRKKHGSSYLKELIVEERYLSTGIAGIGTIPVPSEGALERLWAYASFIQWATGYTEEESVKFILLGKKPPYGAIRGDIKLPAFGQRSAINLKIDPRVTAEELASFYKELQKDFFNTLGEYRKEIIHIPKRGRFLDLDTLKFVEFVLSSTEMSWQERLRQWNEKCYGKKYSNSHIMETVYCRAKKKLNPQFIKLQVLP